MTTLESMIPDTPWIGDWMRFLRAMAARVDALDAPPADIQERAATVLSRRLDALEAQAKAIEDKYLDIDKQYTWLFRWVHEHEAAHRLADAAPPTTDVPTTVTRPWMRDASEWRKTLLHVGLVEVIHSHTVLLDKSSAQLADAVFELLRQQEPTSA